jgi:mycothiol system anti-sigma-R factor
MDCDEAVSRLSRYVDRELGPSEVETVHRHLADCPPCGQLFEFQAELKRLVRKECCTDDAPARLREWVRRLAAEESELKARPGKSTK